MIKCNVNKVTSEKIYHLPIDQQYDKILIGDEQGECYAATTEEAENKDFGERGNTEGQMSNG